MIDTGPDMAEAVSKCFGAVAGRVQADVPGEGGNEVSLYKSHLNGIC